MKKQKASLPPIKLTGGSLSQTVFIPPNVVRKYVDLQDNREYGFVRWYSQMKKMEDINNRKKGLFPKIHGCGVLNQQAYYDMKYLKGYQPLGQVLITSNNIDVVQVNKSLWEKFDTLHGIQSKQNNTNSLYLYFVEEILQKIVDAISSNPDFNRFFNNREFVYDTVRVPHINDLLIKISEYFKDVKLPTGEIIHGNPTLDNIMYSEKTGDIKFIDPYAESVIDTKFLDYAQVLQDSRSHYFTNNSNHCHHISDTGVVIPASLIGSDKLDDFNWEFEMTLGKRFDYDMIKLIDVLEASQFFRMLPFKCKSGDIAGAKFFFVHGCFLMGKLFQ